MCVSLESISFKIFSHKRKTIIDIALKKNYIDSKTDWISWLKEKQEDLDWSLRSLKIGTQRKQSHRLQRKVCVSSLPICEDTTHLPRVPCLDRNWVQRNVQLDWVEAQVWHNHRSFALDKCLQLWNLEFGVDVDDYDGVDDDDNGGDGDVRIKVYQRLL